MVPEQDDGAKKALLQPGALVGKPPGAARISVFFQTIASDQN